LYFKQHAIGRRARNFHVVGDFASEAQFDYMSIYLWVKEFFTVILKGKKEKKYKKDE